MKFKLPNKPETYEEAERQIFYLNCLYKSLELGLRQINPLTLEFEAAVNNLYEVKNAIKGIERDKARLKYVKVSPYELELHRLNKLYENDSGEV